MLSVCLSAAAGAFTHVAWDSFTHDSGAVVRALPALRVLVAEFGGYRLWTYKIVQHSSTICGCILLAYWSWRWFHQTPPTSRPGAGAFSTTARVTFILALFLISVLIGCIRAAQRSAELVSISALQVFLKYAAVSFIATFVVLLIVLAIGWRLRSHIPDATRKS
jgi:glycerol uptake facilitator-like aquaporin